jgi:hypothetical protein
VQRLKCKNRNYTGDLQVSKRYNSIKSTNKNLALDKLSTSALCECLKGRKANAAGYRWAYYTE